MNHPVIQIDRREVGEGFPCFIIAEAGINHNGDIKIAKKMIDLAKKCGADAVKFQTFTAKEFVNNEKDQWEYESQGKKVKESMLKMFERHEFSEEQWKEIADHCKKKGIIFFSTPQNVSNLNLLLKIGVPAIKVGSDDLVNLPLHEAYASKGLPMIISTGMAYMSEIDEAVRTIQKQNKQLAILHCISSYPTEMKELNLRNIITLKKAFPGCVIGFSDHSKGIEACIAAVALGAHILEKHFTLDKNMEGSDHRFSADPQELEALVHGVRNIEKAMGSFAIKPSRKEMTMRKLAHRSIVAALDIPKGQKLTKSNVVVKRPGNGLRPAFMQFVLGKKARQNIKKDDLITFENIG